MKLACFSEQKNMFPKRENQYRVFLSYAHADAQTDAGKELIAYFKKKINAALHVVAGKNLVFLDSEALEWGDEWSARITECIQQCKVFVCLLSPNYQNSSYCKRERLMWERKEIRLGRLRKGTFPVYYIRLEKSQDEELLASQMDDTKPFFESLDEIRKDVVAQKIKRVREISKQIKNKELTEEQAESVAVGFFRISPFFVGRLGELAELCEFIKDHIPIISGGAGVGKTELAVAYASGYAELYPQGRFLLHMEEVEEWNHAIVKLVEDNGHAVNSIKEILCLPENFDKLSIEDKRVTVVQRLWKRSQKGKLLLILDNLENLSLVSDSGLTRLYDGVGDLPGNVDIMATTRNSEFGKIERVIALKHKTPSSRGMPFLYEIDNLDTASAFELFCHISDNQFPFAKCNPESLPEDTQREHDALKGIIKCLHGHAWSLEIIAGFMAKNTRDDITFQSKFEEIKKDTSGIIDQGSFKYRNMAVSPEKLLQPTFDYIGALDEGCGIGTKILELATIAAFFPPDTVSDEALLGYWKKYYSDSVTVDFDDGKFALSQLHALHLLNGEESISKMHRLTRDVLLNRLTEDKQFDIVNQMQKYWDEFKESHYNITALQVRPWTGWANEWVNRQPALQRDEDYLWSVINISNESFSNNFFEESEKLYSIVIDSASKINNESINAIGLANLARLHKNINYYDNAEREYTNALEIFRRLAESSPEIYNPFVAQTLNNLASLHYDLNRPAVAECGFDEALSIYHRLALSNPDCFDSEVADTLNNLAILHFALNRTKEAENEFKTVVEIRRRLASNCPERYNSTMAFSLTNLANLHKNINHFKDAEKEYKEALEILRSLVLYSPERYKSCLASILTNLANIHKDQNNAIEAEKEYEEALSILRHLAVTNPERYDSDVALTIHNLANLHKDFKHTAKALKEYSEVLKIYRRLATCNPNYYASNIALTLTNLANLHSELNYITEAEHEYNEGLSIYRHLASSNPEQYDSGVAQVLTNLAILHDGINQPTDAEQEYNEALLIRRRLALSSPERYDSEVASTLNNLANLHKDLNRLDEAEREYNEALSIRRRLALSSPELYDSDVADTLNNLAILHFALNRIGDAENEFFVALSIRRRLAISNLERYESEVASTLNNLANLHACMNRLVEAEAEYKEALFIRRRLASLSPAHYDSDVATTLVNLANIHIRLHCVSEAECEYSEALETYNRLGISNPARYSSYQALTLTNLAILHKDINKVIDAERESTDALIIYKKLTKSNPTRFSKYIEINEKIIAIVKEKRKSLNGKSKE